jgi:inorganic pyrophosphatase/exopolyphosphatase
MDKFAKKTLDSPTPFPQIRDEEAEARKKREVKRAKASSREFFYSEKLDYHIARQPLKVDDRVVKAASECGIELSWDDEGRVNNISYYDAKILLEKLGGALLSPAEFWTAYGEAVVSGNQEAVEQLQSSLCAEWLDVVFIKDQHGEIFMTEHPRIIKKSDGVIYEGERKKVEMPEGRPGWFDPKNNVNGETGIPLDVNIKRKKGAPAQSSTTWKYWSVFKIDEPVAGIRGYVTSSGTPSLDLDMPVGAKQPVLMLRECRKELPESGIDQELMATADGYSESYSATTADRPALQNPEEHEIFYENREKFFSFLQNSGREFLTTRDKYAEKMKEKFIDMLGVIRILALSKHDDDTIDRVNSIAKDLFRVEQGEVSHESFERFIENSAKNLEKALAEKKKIVFVMGHKNPDADTAVSSLAEAYRNSLMDKEAVFIPVIQGSRIPDEIKYLLGDRISNSILLTDNPDYHKALNSGQARWILVDHNVSEVQKFAISIVDHHILSDKAKKQDVSKSWEMAGSTAALVTQKFHGMGLNLDKRMAEMMYGATLMDTENRSDKKMIYKDNLIMNDLKEKSGIINDDKFFQDLMSYLLNTDDAELLFNRDYKQDWGIFGFAVAKVKNAFDKRGKEVKKDLLDRLVGLAEKNNNDKNFPLTIVKVADYMEGNEAVNKERIYLIFNQYVLPEFKKTMFEFISRIIRHEFADRAEITQTENAIDFSGVGDQLSRKVTAPFFEPIVEAFNEYYYSPATKLYVKREFLKLDEQVTRAAAELGIEMSADRENRVNNITYIEARRILDHLGLSMMNLSEYWKILKEAEETNDEQMSAHLRSSGFVELLDTVILDGKQIIDNPRIEPTGDGYGYEGDKKAVNIMEAVPALISPGSIDPETGFPKRVENPRNYDNKSLWRYWSPDAPECVATRGHIFLLDQSSFDTKIHPDDALPNLGVRPCCLKVKPPIVEILEGEEGVTAKIKKN